MEISLTLLYIMFTIHPIKKKVVKKKEVDEFTGIQL